MALLSAFNPHELNANTVLKVATGREGPLARLLDIVRGNLTAPTIQHVIVSAPRGYGKSFLLRYVQVKIDEIAKEEGLPIAMALLPEELPHVKEPDTLLAEIRRTFLNEPAETVGVRWVEDDGDAWYQRVAELNAAVTDRLGSTGLLIAGIENFDLLVRKAFAKDVQGGSLREFLTRKGNRVMLLTASARGAFDRDYDRPLFKAFEEVALEPWTVDECVAFFRAQRAAAGKPALTDVQEAKAKAVATFIGGTPRLATLIGESLLEDDAVRAADLLDKMVDELTPYYKERIEALPPRSQALLDGLLRGGENCSATELARRVGAPNQPAIAAPLDELRKDLIVVGEKATGSAEVLLRVTDRVFAHYYRKRILSHGQEICPLEALVDLLAVIYSPEEKKREAEKLKARGLAPEAAVMERLWQAEQMRVSLLPGHSAIFREKLDEWDRVTDEGRFTDGLPILDEALAAARKDGDYSAQAEIFGHRGWTLAQLDRYEDGLVASQEAVALAERAGHEELKAFALRNVAFCLTELGRHEEAIKIARDAAALAQSAGNPAGQAAALRFSASSLSELGRNEEAIKIARDAVALAEQADDMYERAAALDCIAFSLSELGRHEETVLVAREVASLAERFSNVSAQASILRLAAFSLGELGRHEEAVSTARESAIVAGRIGDAMQQADALRLAAFGLRELGREEEALATALEAAAFAEKADDVDIRSYVAILLLTFRTFLGLDRALSFYEFLTDLEASSNIKGAVICFDDIAHVVTEASAWDRLAAIFERSPKMAEHIIKNSIGLSEAGKVIVAAYRARKISNVFSLVRHFVTSLAQSIENAADPMLARLWASVLDNSAERIAASIQETAFLSEFEKILAAHTAVPRRAKSVIAAAAAYHAGGRDPATLARLEPDIATMLMTVFPPKGESVKRGRKSRARPKR